MKNLHKLITVLIVSCLCLVNGPIYPADTPVPDLTGTRLPLRELVPDLPIIPGVDVNAGVDCIDLPMLLNPAGHLEWQDKISLEGTKVFRRVLIQNPDETLSRINQNLVFNFETPETLRESVQQVFGEGHINKRAREDPNSPIQWTGFASVQPIDTCLTRSAQELLDRATKYALDRFYMGSSSDKVTKWPHTRTELGCFLSILLINTLDSYRGSEDAAHAWLQTSDPTGQHVSLIIEEFYHSSYSEMCSFGINREAPEILRFRLDHETPEYRCAYEGNSLIHAICILIASGMNPSMIVVNGQVKNGFSITDVCRDILDALPYI